MDIYPEERAKSVRAYPTNDDGTLQIIKHLLYIETDEGATGMSGPIDLPVAEIIHQFFAPLLIGQAPSAIERLWDMMYRTVVGMRKGLPIHAISAVDIALWDLKGKRLGQPVHRLLGGPTRETVPAYARALWHSLEPERVKAQVKAFKEQGYRATKWFFRHGAAEDRQGIQKNMAPARIVREAAGDDTDIMFDAWKSWTLPVAVAMAERLKELEPLWLEEPVWPDKIGCLADLRSRGLVPISTGEHEYNRWGHQALLDAGAADILQPDIYWAGGISEVMKICTLASTHDVWVVPHGESPVAIANVIASQPADLCPWLEDLCKHNYPNQHFLVEPVVPVNGEVHLPTIPGLGVEIDEDKVESSEWVLE